jgi:Arc/MetJ-type ribon-helix-helix transcriptional regulator
MADATETELIGVTLPSKWIKQIDVKIKDDPMTNRQDYIRNLIKKDLEVKA